MKADANSGAMTIEGWIAAAWGRTHAWWQHRPQRKLRLCETLALGERRSVAVVEFERVRYLLGCTSGAITLLSRLPEARDGLTRRESEPPCDP